MATPHSPATPVRLVTLREVSERFGIKKTRIYNDLRDGTLPPPVKRGANCSRWIDHEITNVVAARVAGATDDELRHIVAELVALRPVVATPLFAEARAAVAAKEANRV
ncbi:MAG: AlpA family phage regulatory protein [Burkholderiales bacterium]|nr:AlpA family phage regulatory protein [Burkholderiales bacterium]